MAILFSDNFNRSNGPIGSNYTDMAGTTNIVSNQCVCSTSPYSFFTWTGSPSADQYIEISSVTVPTSPQFTALMLRLDLAGGGDWYHLGWDDNGASIHRYDDAANTQLGATFSAPSAGQTVRFQVVGSTIAVYYDDALITTRTDATYSAAGQIGVFSAGGTIDNLEIGDPPTATFQAAWAADTNIILGGWN